MRFSLVLGLILVLDLFPKPWPRAVLILSLPARFRRAEKRSGRSLFASGSTCPRLAHTGDVVLVQSTPLAQACAQALYFLLVCTQHGYIRRPVPLPWQPLLLPRSLGPGHKFNKKIWYNRPSLSLVHFKCPFPRPPGTRPAYRTSLFQSCTKLAPPRPHTSILSPLPTTCTGNAFLKLPNHPPPPSS